MFHFESLKKNTVMLDCIEIHIWTDIYLYQRFFYAYVFTGLSSGEIKLSQRVQYTLTSGILLLSFVLKYSFP